MTSFIFKGIVQFSRFALAQRKASIGNKAAAKYIKKFIDSAPRRSNGKKYTAAGLLRRGVSEGQLGRSLKLPEWDLNIKKKFYRNQFR
jgi:hypothetical protein